MISLQEHFFCAREELSMKPLQMMHSKHTHILTHIYIYIYIYIYVYICIYIYIVYE